MEGMVVVLHFVLFLQSVFSIHFRVYSALIAEQSDKCHFPRRFVDSSTGVSLQLQMCLLQFTSQP